MQRKAAKQVERLQLWGSPHRPSGHFTLESLTPGSLSLLNHLRGQQAFFTERPMVSEMMSVKSLEGLPREGAPVLLESVFLLSEAAMTRTVMMVLFWRRLPWGERGAQPTESQGRCSRWPKRSEEPYGVKKRRHSGGEPGGSPLGEGVLGWRLEGKAELGRQREDKS